MKNLLFFFLRETHISNMGHKPRPTQQTNIFMICFNISSFIGRFSTKNTCNSFTHNLSRKLQLLLLFTNHHQFLFSQSHLYWVLLDSCCLSKAGGSSDDPLGWLPSANTQSGKPCQTYSCCLGFMGTYLKLVHLIQIILSQDTQLVFPELALAKMNTWLLHFQDYCPLIPLLASQPTLLRAYLVFTVQRHEFED